ncbi:acyl carrier protein [Carboxylicivirga sp. A043]|uniref:acyl carrier protein n=1 Tax=Carboxylicivirga litoralis TaxID=2816963 RepID=UPI0021CAF010|nr:phosphopantetheine-binding protein [Carboxylicivirga sp. A043]MCU4155370.1 acyl carrier protein [Carboxylicivirga sp. A043]
MKEDIRTFISEITFVDKSTIADETKLFEEGIFDSMGLLSLITFLDEQMGVKTDDSDLTEENFQSINTIVAFLERKKSLVN